MTLSYMGLNSLIFFLPIIFIGRLFPWSFVDKNWRRYVCWTQVLRRRQYFIKTDDARQAGGDQVR